MSLEELIKEMILAYVEEYGLGRAKREEAIKIITRFPDIVLEELSRKTAKLAKGSWLRILHEIRARTGAEKFVIEVKVGDADFDSILQAWLYKKLITAKERIPKSRIAAIVLARGIRAPKSVRETAEKLEYSVSILFDKETGAWRVEMNRDVVYVITYLSLSPEIPENAIFHVALGDKRAAEVLVRHVSERSIIRAIVFFLFPEIEMEIPKETLVKAVEKIGLERFAEALGPERLARAVEKIGLERFAEALGPERLARAVEKIGLERIIDAVGIERVVCALKKVGLERLARALGPEELARMIRALPREQREKVFRILAND